MTIGRLALTAFSVALVGCGVSGTSTHLTLDDINVMTSEMGQSLRASAFLSDRDARSPEALVAIDRAENRTRDIIPVGEQWAIMERVKDSSALQELGRDKNLAFVIPAEHFREGVARGAYDIDEIYTDRRPTHQLSGSLLTVTRSGGVDRTDLYVCEFRLVNLENGAVEWSDTFEFKRAARGKGYD